MRRWREKIKSKEELAQILNDLRGEGKRIVFTNGCFDLLHWGHVTYLERAKEEGNLLIVGINSDDSVRRIKGEGRPILPLEERMAVVAALESVDYVVPFEEDTPYQLIALLRPHLLIKGGDWRAEEVVGRELVEEVRIIPYLEGASTSRIIKRVLERYRP